MGLPERRAIAAYQKDVFPRWQQKFNDFLGYNLDIQVDWPTLGADGQASHFEKGFDAIYFEPLMEALKEIAIDDMGKEALKEGFHVYAISGVEPEDRRFYKFENKRLSYGMTFCNIENYVHERKQRIVNMFEEKL
ncbi:hypothetical protein JYJ95_38650 [Corallococcus exiguus]|uniref:hypothetical protein n=1 Tax=Corallococcus exiguus TaxID=83462 RepID=UPI001A8F7A9F|nr:hypothetical protein [Corallococcus exiguus]MBN8472459.1 hypothetical protein [Corallococcus exiguus]